MLVDASWGVTQAAAGKERRPAAGLHLSFTGCVPGPGQCAAKTAGRAAYLYAS